MVETSNTRARRSVFARHGEPDGSVQALRNSLFEMRADGARSRWCLRGDAENFSRLGAAGGFDLTQAINSARSAPHGPVRISLRLGPDEWLLIADADAHAEISNELATDLSATAHSLVDISHRNVGIELTGTRACDVINTACALDLGAAAFPVGSATRTLFGKAEIVLMRADEVAGSPRYHVECGRSFGRYLHAHLCESAKLLGLCNAATPRDKDPTQ